jgi:hypothetical protein
MSRLNGSCWGGDSRVQEGSGSNYRFLSKASADRVVSDNTRRPFRCFSSSAGIHPREEERRTVEVGGELRMPRRAGRSSLLEMRCTGLQDESNDPKLGTFLWDNSERKRWPGAGEFSQALPRTVLQVLPRGSEENASVRAGTKRFLGFVGREVAQFPRVVAAQRD